MNLSNVVCPDCHSGLEQVNLNVQCPGCGTVYPIRDDILSFVESDDFYEGKFAETRDPLNLMPAFLGPLRYPAYRVFLELNIVLKAERFFRHRLTGKKHLRILDLACGGGWKFLTEYGSVTGIDLSLISLKNARSIYPDVYRANALHLPFPDNSFDVVTSIDFFEHVPEKMKVPALREMIRVLKPEGKIIKYMPVDSNEWLTRFTKRYPALYRKYWIDQDDHNGLIGAREVLNVFAEAGIPVKKHRRCWVNLLAPVTYVKYLDNEYTRYSRYIRFCVSVSRWLVRRNILFGFASVLLGPVSDLIDSLAPQDHGLGLLVYAEKMTKGDSLL